MMYPWFVLSIWILTICWSTVLLGQTEDVTLDADSIAYQIDLSDVVVTGQMRPTGLKKAVHQLKIISAEEIKSQGFLHLQQVLENQLNLRISTDPILGNGLRIQGIGGENVAILIDGVPMIGRLGGNIDLSQINLQQIARIEIVQGAMSAQYGSNAAGGVINLIRKNTQKNTWELSQQHQIEFVGNQQHHLQLGYQNKKWLTQVNYTYYKSQLAEDPELRVYEPRTTLDGRTYQSRVVPWNPKDQHILGGLLKYRWNDSLNLQYNWQVFQEELRLLGRIRRPQFKPYHIDEYFTTDRLDHHFKLDGYIFKGAYLQSSTAINDYKRASNTERTDIEKDSTFGVPEESNIDRFGSILHRSSLGLQMNAPLEIQLGIEYYDQTGSGPRIKVNGEDETARLRNYATWLGLQYSWKSLQLIANVRYGHNDKFDHPIIPSLQARYNFNTKWTFKAGYAHGFRAPSIKELYFEFIDVSHYIIGNPELKAEYAQNIYSSIHFNAAKINGEFRLFHNRIEDRIVTAAFETSKFNYQNLSNFTSYGSNVQLNIKPVEHLGVDIAASYTEVLNPFAAETADEYVGSWELRNAIQYKIPKINLQTNLSHRFFGKQIQYYATAEGIGQGNIEDYHLLHCSVQKSFWNEHISVTAGVQNVLDVQRIGVSGSSGGAHSSGAGQRLINWGRSPYVRLDISWPLSK